MDISLSGQRAESQRHDERSVTRQVLVIDDEEAIRLILKASLELTTQWNVLLADSGAEGMVMAQAEQPDAILLDVMMPQLDGITLFHQLKAQAITRHIPVIFLTAQAGVERQALEELGTGVIAKPFEPKTVAAQLRELLGWA